MLAVPRQLLSPLSAPLFTPLSTTNANITFSTNLDESGLTRAGDTWSTAGYAAAADQVHIDLEGNAASFTLNPKGGCG